MPRAKRELVFNLSVFVVVCALVAMPGSLVSCGRLIELDMNSGRIRTTERVLGIPVERRTSESFVSERVTDEATPDWVRVYRSVRFGRTHRRIDAPRHEMHTLGVLSDAGVIDADAAKVAAEWLLERWRVDLFDHGRRQHLLELENETMMPDSDVGEAPVSGDRVAAYLAAYPGVR